jgi:outer membrane protein OmpA-like peptidoglycan-associated protein
MKNPTQYPIVTKQAFCVTEQAFCITEQSFCVTEQSFCILKRFLKYVIIFFLFFCYFLPFSHSQNFIDISNATDKLKKSYKEAYKIIDAGDFKKGIFQMEKIIKKNPTFINPYLLVADLYKQIGDTEKSLNYFNQAVQIAPDYEPRAYYLMAQLQMNKKNYQEAITHLKKYLAYPTIAVELKRKANKMILDAEFLPTALANPVPFNPVSVGKGVNTAAWEYFPCVTADENTLIYTRQLGEGNQTQEDLYISKRINGIWSKGEPLPNVNTTDNEGAQTISANGKTLVFTVCNRMGDFGSCDLYLSELKNGKWSEAKNIGAPICSPMWESQPSLSAHGDALFFARGNPKDRSNTDIYISKKNEKGEWAKPEPIEELNTEYADQAPFIHPDGQTLYFSSGGYGSLGANDLYMSKLQPNGKFGKPQNLGYPINTNLEEEALTVSFKGNLAYIASNRLVDKNGKTVGEGGLDIFQFELPANMRPNPITYASIIVYDALTNKILPNTQLQIENLTDNLPFLTAKTDATGEFLASMPLQKNYGLSIKKEGYLFHSENFGLESAENNDKPFLLKVYLQPIPKGNSNTEPNKNPKELIDTDSIVGKPIVLRNVFFEINSAELLPQSKSELEQLKKMLEENPSIRICVDGHTDNDGDDDKNKILSNNRAQAVCNYLIQQGINTIRLRPRGFGESRPIDNNENQKGKANNRRTEFSVLAN